MKKALFAIFFTLCSFAIHGEEDIVVHLSRQTPLVSVYLGKVVEQTSSYDSNYLQSLQDILFFDLSSSGQISAKSAVLENDATLAKASFKEAFAAAIWPLEKYKYVLLPKISKNMFSLMLYSVEYNTIKHYKNIEISGDLASDRTKIHKLSDAIYKALFNKNGISSTKILYTLQTVDLKSKSNNFISEIWECDFDGKNSRKLTSGSDYCITPVYFPSRLGSSPSKFLYVTYEKGPSKIFISPLSEQNAEPFIKLRGNQLLPSISRDRSKIAFICDVSGRADLFVQPIHPERGLLGKPIQVYSFPSSVQASPTFSPNGKQIAFVSDKEGTPRIYLVEAPHHLKGRNLPEATLLSKKNRENTCPSWSPDGRKLAYSAKTDGVRQIWIYDFETKEERQLTSGKSHKENPCWAPNSLHIVFNTADSHSSELHLVNLNQPKTIKITSGPGKKHYPAWQP